MQCSGRPALALLVLLAGLCALVALTGCGGAAPLPSAAPSMANTPGDPPAANPGSPSTTPTNPGSPSTTSTTPSGATLTTYGSNLRATSGWTVKQMLPDGAILFGSSEIVPYYSNIAAIGLIKDPSKYAQVEAWMKWYIAHLNTTDVWGLGGTMYDYSVSGSMETSTNNADSTDSYAATFLTLAWDFYQTGDATAQSYVKSIAPQLVTIGQVLVNTQQSDGLTWAKPNYQIKYLIDNCEGYRGMRDAASLFAALGDSTQAMYYDGRAALMLQGIRGCGCGVLTPCTRTEQGDWSRPTGAPGTRTPLASCSPYWKA